MPVSIFFAGYRSSLTGILKANERLEKNRSGKLLLQEAPTVRLRLAIVSTIS
jgi:hypothetical protein